MTTQGIPPEQEPIILSRACPPNCRGSIPPETITDEASGIRVANRDREVWDRAILFAVSKFKDILTRMAENTPEAFAEPPKTVVQAGTDLVDNAFFDLLNPLCPYCNSRVSYLDYLLPSHFEKWLSSGNGSKYLAALVNAVLEAQR